MKTRFWCKPTTDPITRDGTRGTGSVNVFLRQLLRVGGLPFDVTVNTPNAVTIAAMREAEQLARDPNAKHYTDVEQALRELKR